MADLFTDVDGYVARSEKPVTIEAGPGWVGRDGTPSTLDVISYDCPAFVRRLDALDKSVDLPESTPSERQAIIMAMASVVGWSGWENNGGPAEFNDANLARLLTKVPSLMARVRVQSEKSNGFFGETSRDS